ncbi:hypothetical protein PCANC_18729 [Puccinia coronata f. sp. avenae]|uniref:Uncharacterized protein n=1 Tax=Puccinia coronata f. sp. avenae TaxID=200324 RepID=A0A2N5UAT6_9BASI|nr:hypothetical protein PCANC_18729 [Puccinia coronata f. sp. avenae]
MPQTSLRRNPRLRAPSGPDLGSPAALERPVSCQLSGYPFSRLRINPSAYSTGYTPQICRTIMPDGLLLNPLFPRFYPQYRSGISIGRNAVFPAFLQQLPSSRCMTVICATRAISKSSPYPYQSTLSQSYRRRSRASSGMSSPQDVKPYVPANVSSSAADTAAASNARPTPAPLFRLPTHHHFDVVDQHGSIIRRPIAECPLPVFRPPLSIRKPRAVIGQNAHRIAPPFFDPLPALSNLGPTPFRSFQFIQEVQSHPALRVSAVDSSGDAQMRPASETRGRLTGDPARIAEATRVYNQAHDLFVNPHYDVGASPHPRPASEPRAPTTNPIETDSEPADTQSEPLLTNDQGDPVSVTYPSPLLASYDSKPSRLLRSRQLSPPRQRPDPRPPSS